MHYQFPEKYPTKKDFAVATQDDTSIHRRLTFQMWDGKITNFLEGINPILERATLSQKNYEETMSKLRLFDI